MGFINTGAPGQFNRYAYTWNDPINATDPNGEFLKLVKSAYNVGKRTYKNGGNLKGALKDEALSYVENGATLLSKDASFGDKAFAAFDLVTGFGDEAKGAKQLLSKGKCCFVAGTLVETEDGLRPIEEIEVGDLVWARDEETGEEAFKPVLGLIRLHDRVIWDLETVSEKGVVHTFRTTDDHPWWVDGHGWKRTDELTPKDILATQTGKKVSVLSVTNTNLIEPTFNFEVADFNTYFVGESKVWVHNAHCNIFGNAQQTKKAGELTTHGSTSDRLVGEMMDTGDYVSGHLNQTINTITGGAVPSKVRPDVATVRPDGIVDVGEVLSPGQTAQEMTNKLQNALGDRCGTITCVDPD